jgi:hypothetical protein
MATERQLAAARANGAKSRGPKTPEGKRISARNSRKHGLYAQSASPEPESAAHFERLVISYTSIFQPKTPTETALIETMADAWARYQRVIGLQESILHSEILNQAAQDPSLDRSQRRDYAVLAARATTALTAQQPACQLLFRHEGRYARQFSNAFDRLQKMRKRTARPAAEFENLQSAQPQIFEPAAPANHLLRNEPDFNRPHPHRHACHPHPNPTPIIKVSNQIKDFRDR